jgi:hypothetical protein
MHMLEAASGIAPTSPPLVPLWLVLPATGLLMAIVTAHVLVLRDASSVELSPRRRRIRLANGGLLYALIPLLAFGMAVVTPASPRAFLLVWTSIAAIAGMILTLGIVEALLIQQEHRVRLARLRREAAAPSREPSDG